MTRAVAIVQAAPKPLRCAIYTRKSTEHGLDQAFNSLDNQREAAEAYIKSQAHEGWRLLPACYDDGGFSGGRLDRPALQRLLDEVRASRIDVVVVYKVDRLTRSLADFAKLVELFDQHGTSFVSVTQAFNTTSSMGRLTLNVLLSFAQFEREVTGERIRDKIAASKRRGLRVGGPVPLGYIVRDKTLVPCPTEAEQVRLIFRRSLDVNALTALMQDLDARGIRTKVSPRRDGTVRGGLPFNASGLSQLLKNRCYIGEVVHKGRHYPGQHEAIVPADLFGAVQDILAPKSRRDGHPVVNGGSLLTGLLFDARGIRMTPSSSKKNGAHYRYYVSGCRGPGRQGRAAPPLRVSAPDIEAVVTEALAGAFGGPPAAPHDASEEERQAERTASGHDPLARVARIVLHDDRLDILCRTETHDQPPRTIAVPWTPTRHRPRRALIGPVAAPDPKPIRSETRARLVQGIANARLWLDELAAGTVASTRALADREGCSERHIRMTLTLAFLSPTIVNAAVAGTLPAGHGVARLTDSAACWTDQDMQLLVGGSQVLQDPEAQTLDL